MNLRIVKVTSLVIFLCLLVGQLSAQDMSEFRNEEFIQSQDTLKYRILYPEKMKNGEKYPLVLFLHGSGERGGDNQKQLTHGAKLFVDKTMREKYPAFVLFPQCPNNVMWSHRKKKKSERDDWIFNFPLEPEPTKPAGLVNQLIEKMLGSELVDTNQVYIMGLSMGGIGALEFLYRWPEKYSAAVVICGGNDPQFASVYCHIPVWFFHGGKDNVVPQKFSQAVYDELKKRNLNTKYTLYPDANHNSWDPALAEPDLLKWLFKERE